MASRFNLRTDLAFVCFSTRAPDSDAVARFFSDAYGLAVPEINRVSQGEGGARLLRSRSDQVLLFGETPGLVEEPVPEFLKGQVYRTDLSDAWLFLHLSGAKVMAFLERLSTLDLAGPRFPAGSVAETAMNHVGVYLIRLAGAEFLLGVPRSYAAHFVDALEDAARLLD